VPHNESLEHLEEELNRVLPEEVDEAEWERMRRKRIAMENAGAVDRLSGMTSMDRSRGG